MNEVAKYHNDLNTISMRKWTSEEMNFFFTIVAKAREQGVQTLIMKTDELKELSRFSDEHNQRWQDTMANVANKITELKYVERTSKKISIMTLFQQFDVWIDEKKVEITVSNKFEYVLNQIKANFTIFELEEFTKIRSTYAKSMYRLLKQWRTVGYKEFTLQEFKLLLDVPKSYKVSNIDTRVLKPILDELQQSFKGLSLKKIKASTRGNKLLGYKFTWQAEQTGTWEDDKFNPEKKKGQRKETLPDWATDTAPVLTKLEESIYKEWHAEQMAQYDITIPEFLALKSYTSKEKMALQRALKKLDKN